MERGPAHLALFSPVLWWRRWRQQGILTTSTVHTVFVLLSENPQAVFLTLNLKGFNLWCSSVIWGDEYVRPPDSSSQAPPTAPALHSCALNRISFPLRGSKSGLWATLGRLAVQVWHNLCADLHMNAAKSLTPSSTLVACCFVAINYIFFVVWLQKEKKKGRKRQKVAWRES